MLCKPVCVSIFSGVAKKWNAILCRSCVIQLARHTVASMYSCPRIDISKSTSPGQLARSADCLNTAMSVTDMHSVHFALKLHSG